MKKGECVKNRKIKKIEVYKADKISDEWNFCGKVKNHIDKHCKNRQKHGNKDRLVNVI